MLFFFSCFYLMLSSPPPECKLLEEGSSRRQGTLACSPWCVQCSFPSPHALRCCFCLLACVLLIPIPCCPVGASLAANGHEHDVHRAAAAAAGRWHVPHDAAASGLCGHGAALWVWHAHATARQWFCRHADAAPAARLWWHGLWVPLMRACPLSFTAALLFSFQSSCTPLVCPPPLSLACSHPWPFCGGNATPPADTHTPQTSFLFLLSRVQ